MRGYPLLLVSGFLWLVVLACSALASDTWYSEYDGGVDYTFYFKEKSISQGDNIYLYIKVDNQTSKTIDRFEHIKWMDPSGDWIKTKVAVYVRPREEKLLSVGFCPVDWGWGCLALSDRYDSEKERVPELMFEVKGVSKEEEYEEDYHYGGGTRHHRNNEAPEPVVIYVCNDNPRCPLDVRIDGAFRGGLRPQSYGYFVVEPGVHTIETVSCTGKGRVSTSVYESMDPSTCYHFR